MKANTEGYITLEKGEVKESFYVYSDLSCTWRGIFCEDFSELFMLLADLGWKKAKETLIPKQEKETVTEMPVKIRSRKGEFIQDWFAYENANLANIF